MNKLCLNLIVLLVLLAAACSTEKETPNGFKYKIVEKGDGVTPKPEQFIVFNYLISDSKDSTWMDSGKDGFPGAYQIQDSSGIATEVGMQQMFRMLSKGDSVTITRPLKDFFKNVLGGTAPPKFDTTMNMTCNLRVVNVLDRQGFDSLQRILIVNKTAKQKSKDAELIEKYLTENKIVTVKDTSGVQFIQYTNSGNQKPTVDDCVQVRYKGRLLSDGKVFDQNNEGVTFPLRQVIQGWQIGIPKLGVGDSATFFIPSALAYGPRGRPSIPPDAILVFDVQLLAVKEIDPETGSCK
jgi:FKBP-type peptidyl-prolyl cis-trans isomerase FkpA